MKNTEIIAGTGNTVIIIRRMLKVSLAFVVSD
jgi:hypothetical protein